MRLASERRYEDQVGNGFVTAAGVAAGAWGKTEALNKLSRKTRSGSPAGSGDFGELRDRLRALHSQITVAASG